MIDFRSDTSTMPTNEMIEEMTKAKIGNEGYGDDPTIKELERRAAEITGKESSIFLPSGTMGNLVAVTSHVQRGDEVILESDSHIITNECGGLCVVSGAIPRTLKGSRGVMDVDELKMLIRRESAKTPKTSLICLENTHNKSSGSILPFEYIKMVSEIAHERGIPIHLDGARIFNASVATKMAVKTIVEPVDSVMFCLSKGLACPVGSILAGRKDFIEKARYVKKMLGGVMRQAGILAAAGLVALDKMIDRLSEDHRNAKYLASGLSVLPGFKVEPRNVETNMVYFEIEYPDDICREIIKRLKNDGILVDYKGNGLFRMVTHKDIGGQDIEKALSVFRAAVSTK